MIDNLYIDLEWLEPGEAVPHTLQWSRTDVLPRVGDTRFFLGSEKLQENAENEVWVLFQPANSSIDKSFEDHPSEITGTLILKVALFGCEPFNFDEVDNTRYYSRDLNVWYECQVLETIRVLDIPEVRIDSGVTFPEYEYPHEVQRFEFKDFIVICWDEQDYAGKKSLILKQNDEMILTIHNEWFGDEDRSVCYNYRLTHEERDRVLSYGQN